MQEPLAGLQGGHIMEAQKGVSWSQNTVVIWNQKIVACI